MTALNTIDSENLFEGDLAYWNYLRTRAAIKSYQTVTWLLDMEKAAQYYKKFRTPNDAAWAYYYLGCAYRSNQNDSAAIIALAQSLDLQDLTRPTRLLGFCYIHLEAIYQKAGLYQIALEYALKSKRIAIAIHDDKCLAQAFDDVATCYALLKKYKQSADYAYKGIELAKRIEEPLLIANHYQTLAHNYEMMNLLDSALIYANLSYKIQPLQASKIQISYLKASIFKEMGVVDSAEIYYKKALYSVDINTKKNASTQLAIIAEAQKDSAAAIKYYNLANTFAEESKAKNPIDKLIQNTTKEKVQEQMIQSDKDQAFEIWAISLSLCGVCVFIYLIWKKVTSQADQSLMLPKIDNQNVIQPGNVLICKYDKTQVIIESLPKTILHPKMLTDKIDSFIGSSGYAILQALKADKYRVLQSGENKVVRESLDMSFKSLYQTTKSISPNINYEEFLTLILFSMQYSFAVLSLALDCSEAAARKRIARIKGKLTPELNNFFFK